MAKKKSGGYTTGTLALPSVKTEVNVNGNSKISRYEWNTDTGPKPIFKWVAKRKIWVDRRYQRGLNDAKVISIASGFFWPAFGAASVVERPDGTMVAVDCQHRIAATYSRDDVNEIPCLVYSAASVEEEARIFLMLNTLRKALTAVDKFNPMVETGDGVAVGLKKLAASTGRKMAPGNTEELGVSCVSKMIKLARYDFDRLSRLWPLLHELFSGDITEVLAGALFYVEGHIEGSLTEDRWHRRVLSVGEDRLSQAARRSASAYSKGGDRIWALGVVEAINCGLRSSRLSLQEDTNRRGAPRE